MKQFSLILLLFCSSLNFAQKWEWAKTIGTRGYFDYASSVGVDRDGNSYITGVSKNVCRRCPSYYYNIFAKFDPQGKLVWKDTIQFYESRSVTDLDGNTYITSGVKLGKYDSNGKQLWMVYDTTAGYSNITLHPHGGVIVAGHNPKSQGKMAIGRFDAGGNKLWQRRNDTWANCCRVDAIACDKQGNTYFAGGFDTTKNIINTSLLLKFDIKGELIFKQNVPNNPISVRADGDGVYVLGTWGTSVQIGGVVYPESYGTSYLIKYKESGEEDWSKIIRGPLYEVSDLEINNDGEVYLVGTATHSITVSDELTLVGNYTSFIVKFSPEGRILWHTNSSKDQAVNGNPYTSRACDVTVDSKGHLWLAGYFYGQGFLGDIALNVQDYTPYYDMMVAKLDENGNTVGISQEETNSIGFSVYPNPSADHVFNISCNTCPTEANCEVKVYNMIGQCVYSQRLSDTATINLHNLSRGCYVVSLSTLAGSQAKKIVIE